MNCDDCNGACCRWILMPYARTREVESWIKARGGRWEDGAYWLPHTCPMLEGGRCTIYGARPLSCRIMSVGGHMCRTCRKLEGFKD